MKNKQFGEKLKYIKKSETHWSQQGLRNSLYYGNIMDYSAEAIDKIYNDFKTLNNEK